MFKQDELDKLVVKESNLKKWNEPGTTVIGKYGGYDMREGKDAQFRVHWVTNADGETETFTGTAVLNDRLKGVPVDSLISIEYLGILGSDRHKSFTVKVAPREKLKAVDEEAIDELVEGFDKAVRD